MACLKILALHMTQKMAIKFLFACLLQNIVEVLHDHAYKRRDGTLLSDMINVSTVPCQRYIKVELVVLKRRERRRINSFLLTIVVTCLCDFLACINLYLLTLISKVTSIVHQCVNKKP